MSLQMFWVLSKTPLSKLYVSDEITVETEHYHQVFIFNSAEK